MSIDAALGRLGNKSGVCTSSTRPTNPFEGQLIYETDTNRTLVYDNAAWLVVADNQVLSIDSTNSRVGIGTTSPEKGFHVVVGSKSGGSYGATHDLLVDSDGDTGIGIYSGTANNGFFRFGDSLNVASGGFNYDHATDDLFIRTAGTDCVTIDSSGDVAFANGIYLGGTTASNYVDDYEEGSWTPTFSASQNIGTVTGIASSECYYRKMGNWVDISGALSLSYSALVTITSGAAYLSINTNSLPFTPELLLTDSILYQIGTCHFYNNYGGGNNAFGFMAGNAATVWLYVGMAVIGSPNTSDTLFFQGSYRVD